MKRVFSYIVIFAIFLNSCGVSSTNPPQEMDNVPPAKPTLFPTLTHKPPTPTIISETKVPTLTLTPSPVIDSQGNITWHPQKVLIADEIGGGDGVGFDYPPEFVLLWDGTLLQPSEMRMGQPYVSHLDQTEICKILNTIDASGFLDETGRYDFPFDGLGSQYITVNAWKSNSSGSQVFTYALSGAPYYDGLFCRNCPVPSEDTIIRPGLANVYFFLKNYVSETREVAPVEKIKAYIWPVDQEPTDSWPITSISLSEFSRKCNESYCYDVGMILDGEIAQEFIEKIRSSQVFVNDSIMKSQPFRIVYRALWPYEPSIMYYSPLDETPISDPSSNFQLACTPENGYFPLLPLSKDNKFWIYAPDGKWGAEVVDEPGQLSKIRVVNKMGYEKLYQYDPLLFSQTSLKVFPRFWTEDGEYFFVNILPGEFDYTKTPFVNSIGLQRISISDGKVSFMFAGVDGQEYAYAMSEDGRQIVYIRQGDYPLRVTIKDTYYGNESTTTLSLPVNGVGEYVGAGTITWSVDKKTVYVAALYSENNSEIGYLIAIDVLNPAKQAIVYEKSTQFKLNQFTFHDRDAGICEPDADIETYCSIRLNLEDGTVGK